MKTYFYITVVGVAYGYDLVHALTTLDSRWKKLRFISSSIVDDEKDVDNMIAALKNDVLTTFKNQAHGRFGFYRVRIISC